MSTLRPYIFILAAVGVLFALVHGCSDTQRSSLIKQFTSPPTTPDSESATPVPLSADDKAHLKRLSARRKMERAAVQRFSAAMADNADQLADHIKSVRGYLDEPHYDDSVWQGNIRAEAQAVEEEAQQTRAIKAPQQCKSAYRIYLVALELDRSAAHTLPKALDTHHDDWIQASLKKFDQAAEKVQSASNQVKVLESVLTTDLGESE